MAGQLTVGSLFSGIGGLDLGLERASMQVLWQVEIDEYCRKVLAKHWPDVARYGDIRDCGAHNLAPVDVLAGGFPCQDISKAGRREGITGARSGLWRAYARIIGELRPRYVLVENVAALLVRGMGTVLGDLATLGYDAEWSIVSACALGAPHTRERLFIVAYPCGAGFQGPRYAKPVADYAWRGAAPRLRGSTAGVPQWMERLRAIGNSVSPPVAEYIGRLIVEHAAMDCERAS